MKNFFKLLLIIVFSFATTPAFGIPPLAEVLPLPDTVRDNLRLSLDLSTRPSWAENRDDFFFQNVIGLDLHKVVSSEKRDWGTLIVQTYLTRIDRFDPVPAPFDDGDDWEMIYRILNFNLMVRPDGRLNFRVGHFEIPFGLEHVVNTNGTLRDYLHPRNFGMRADWGASLNGDFPAFEYEIGLTRGSGNEWKNAGDPWSVAGRIGTPRSDRVSVGVSGFRGNTITIPGSQERWKLGLDATTGYGPFAFLAETSFGKNGAAEIANSLGEVNWTDADEQWLTYVQLRVFAEERPIEWDEMVSAAIGTRFTPNAHWSLSAALNQDLQAFKTLSRETKLSVQLRFRL